MSMSILYFIKDRNFCILSKKFSHKFLIHRDVVLSKTIDVEIKGIINAWRVNDA